jgi:hypothetical protein
VTPSDTMTNNWLFPENSIRTLDTMHNSILTTQSMQIDFYTTYQHKRSSKLIQRKEKIIEKEKKNIYIYIYIATQNLPENTVNLFLKKKNLHLALRKTSKFAFYHFQNKPKNHKFIDR